MNKFKKRMRCGISLFGLWGCQKKSDVTILPYDVPATPGDYVADCFSKGFLHFSDKGDYVLDEFGFEHLLSWTPAGTKETKYYRSKDGVSNEELSKDKFADGEQIVFGFDPRETYSSAGVTCVWKYSDILLTQWVEVRGKFIGKDLIQFISNLLGENLYESDHEIPNYSFSVFEKEIANVEEVLKRSRLKNITIRSVIISLPGLVNQKTGALQVSPQFSNDLFSNSHTLISLFENAFHCPVVLENDTKLRRMAELAKGSFKNGNSGLLAYIDYGIGGAFEFDDKLYWGARGYSGEIGRLVVKTDGETHHLDDFASLRVIQEKVSKTKGKNLSLSEIYDLFQQGDEEVRKEVGISARSVGKALKEIIRVFDIDQFILSGGITNFGDFYLRTVQEETKRANENAIVRFSHLNNYAICDGAKERGITKVLSSALNNLKTQ